MFGGAAAWCGCSLERFEQLLAKRTISETAPMVMRCCARIKWVACFAAHPFSVFDFAHVETLCPEEIMQGYNQDTATDL
jgi:hypothetical protein